MLPKLTKRERVKAILAWFEAQMPIAETELNYTNPYELIVAVILSAQCTDKRINQVTPALFEAFPTVEDLARADSDLIFSFIRSVSYPNNKAKHLAGMARQVVELHGGQIPFDRKALEALPGVGRKTASVVLSVAFEEPAIAVDTHVFRVSARLGLSYRAKTPTQTELQLMKLIPKDKWNIAHHWLILHGRYACLARNPQCERCGILSLCPYGLKRMAEPSASA
jgi:endonuclease-3